MIDANQYRWLKLESVDAWFFRDGRPSNRGEDQSDLESEFPPNPATVVGALRAALARQNGWSGHGSWATEVQLTAILGDGFDNLGLLSFLGPILMEDEEILWPMPRHVLGCTVENRFQPVGLLEPTAEPVLCDAGEVRLPRWIKPETAVGASVSDMKPPQPPTGVFVTTAGMSKILSGGLPDSQECRCGSELFKHEPRVGIQREADSRTTGPNAMYSPQYVRPKSSVTLVVGICGLPDDWYLPSLVALGGESRMAGVEPLDEAPAFPTGETAGSYRLAISVTPSRFSNRWWGASPDDDAGKLSPLLSGRIATLMLERPQRIGGWNSVDGSPLPLRPFVPSGTVWWIEATQMMPPRQLQVGEATAYGYGLTVTSGHKKN